jgi:CubicO group peptidase (beta-lactamase class C family)
MDRRSVLKFAVAAGAVDLAVTGSSASAEVLGKGLAGKDYAGALKTLRAYASLHLAEYGLPGMTVAVVDRDGFAATFQVGFADVDRGVAVGPDHLYQIGSISKSFAAIAILQANQAGKLDLDSAVNDHLPEIGLPASPRITVRHLLSHTGGLPDDAPFFPRNPDGRLWSAFPPGSQLSYSNTGYALLGLILERVHGRPYYETIQRQILEPLGMKGTRPTIAASDRKLYANGYQAFQMDRPVPWPTPLASGPWTNFAEASGSIAAPPRDMARYLRFLIDAGSGKGAPLLSDPQAALFTKPVIPAAIFGPGAQYAMGTGVVLFEGRPMLHHTGGMICFSSSFHVDAAAGVGCFASTNVNIDSYRPRAISAFACALFRAVREGLPVPAAPAIDLGDTLKNGADYAGEYRSASGEGFAIRAHGGRLELVEGGRAVGLQQKAEDVFLARRPDLSLYLLAFRREKGKVVAAGHGEKTFGRDGLAPPPAEAPPALKVMAGRYDNDDPWRGTFRVIARPDGLTLDGIEPLVPLSDGSYRVGLDPAGCERIRFDGMVNGQALRLNFSGVDFWRTPDPV